MKVPIDGAQSALLLAGSFALHCWEFERKAAQRMIPAGRRAEIARLYHSISSRWRDCLMSNGLWQSPTGIWTPDLIARRAMVTCEFDLSESQVSLAIIGLRACAEEFQGNWEEFCTVLPGALDWYELDIDGLGVLAGSLDRHLSGKSRRDE